MLLIKKVFTFFTILSAFFLISCSTNSENSSPCKESTKNDDEIITSKICYPEKSYTITDFETAGLKKPKSLKADAVDKKTGERITPEATEVHLGFYKSTMGPKDIELRFYKNHQDALKHGVPVAEKTISVPSEAGGAVKGAGTFAKSSYGAYAVVGNVIMLCQVQIEVCDELVSEME